MTESLSIPIHTNLNGLIERVEGLAVHVGAAEVGDPVAEMARAIGEIDLDTCIEMQTEFRSGTIYCDVSPIGDLAKLLNAYEGAPQ